MNNLIQDAISISIEKYGFEANEGNREAVTAIVNNCLDSFYQSVNDETQSSNVISKQKLLSHQAEIAGLEREVLELKEDNARHLRLIDLDTKKLIEWGDKAGAWDDLEALVCKTDLVKITWMPSGGFLVKIPNNPACITNTLKEAVSNALASIKGE